MHVLHVRTFEGDRLVLEHSFFGDTKEAATGILRAHMGTDVFLRSALNTGNYRGIPLRNQLWWSEI